MAGYVTCAVAVCVHGPLYWSAVRDCGISLSYSFTFHAFYPYSQDVHVLDAGCGTGNYAKALIDYGVGKVTLMDASHNMLSKARDKLKDAIDKKIVDQVIEAILPKIPVEDGTFDMVLYSLVRYYI